MKTVSSIRAMPCSLDNCSGVDRNHDGISQSNELITLASTGIQGIDLKYTETQQEDRFGNVFRFKGKLLEAGAANSGNIIYDVVFAQDTYKPVTTSNVPTKQALVKAQKSIRTSLATLGLSSAFPKHSVTSAAVKLVAPSAGGYTIHQISHNVTNGKIDPLTVNRVISHSLDGLESVALDITNVPGTIENRNVYWPAQKAQATISDAWQVVQTAKEIPDPPFVSGETK
jgi:hypothetical protein